MSPSVKGGRSRFLGIFYNGMQASAARQCRGALDNCQTL